MSEPVDFTYRVGGPLGSRARRAGLWFNPAFFAFTAATLTWLILIWRQVPCRPLPGDAFPNPFLRMCYSDIPILYLSRHITRNKSEEPPVIVDLVPQEGRGFIFEARTSQLMAGDYTARLQVDGAPLDGVIETELSVSQQLTPELQDVSANRSVLEQAASLTGGRFLLPDQLHELPDLFHDSSQSQEVREEIPVWNHWLILVLFCIVGTSEWVLRKINGLP